MNGSVTTCDPVSLVPSAVPGLAWPPVPGADAAHALALQFQFELSEWYTPEELQALQFRQLDALARHAWATVPYYRERWRGIYDPEAPLTPERFARLPVLTRSSLQAGFESLKSTAPIPAHGAPRETRSSGSTGTPVRVLKTPLTDMVWQATALRDHLWHRRRLQGKAAVIRYGIEAGAATDWGGATRGIFATGGSVQLPVTAEIGAQLAWLEREQPEYLQAYPSIVAELARLSMSRGTRLAGLRGIITVGEMLTAEVRALAHEAWNVPVADIYSAEETGYLALQCPAHERYHVQSEAVAVEILNSRGKACTPGEVGLVVATPLHNFAMPLVRYVVGDYAEAAGPCPCGRGLPALARIMGRVRNTLVLADGRRYWPLFGGSGLGRIAPVLQHQVVQIAHDVLEARLVTARPLTAQEEEALRVHMQSRLPAPLSIRFAYPREIKRNAAGKYDVFVSEVEDAGLPR